jgi:hypothetical protein
MVESPPNEPASRITWVIRAPKLALDISFAIAFLSAVAHLFLDSRDVTGVFWVFLFPPVACYLYAHSPRTRTSTKIVTTLFLAMIDCGDVMAWALPKLGKDRDTGLWSHGTAILNWYMGCYLIFIFVILPPVLFIRPLIARYQRRSPEFSVVTCLLGLLLWVLMAPFTVETVVRFLIHGPLPRNNN